MENYDLIVIGGGSAGLACAKTAAQYNKSIVVLNYVVPSPRGTTWGIGGTCVNVGCIPKKLFHQAALLKKAVSDADYYGWKIDGMDITEGILKNDWLKLVSNVGNHIKSLQWKIRVELRSLNIKLMNAFGSFIDSHTINAVVATTSNNRLRFKNITIRGSNIVIATGCRPRIPRNPVELSKYCITYEEIFHSKTPPMKTLIIGAGYIGLETAGFLQGLGYPVTIVVRNKLLKEFDQQMVKLVKEYMEAEGIRFCVECEVVSVKEKIFTTNETAFHKIHYVVSILDKKNKVRFVDEFDTIYCAVGRHPTTSDLNLHKARINYSKVDGKIFSNHGRTNVPHIYVAGDVVSGIPELTSLAMKTGKSIAKQMFQGGNQEVDYKYVPTVVFTPLEYGTVGYSEDAAKDNFGDINVEVYHGFYFPLEFEIPRFDQAGDNSRYYIKLITAGHNENIVGLHVTGPHAGDMVQGFAVAIKNGLTIKQLQNSVGIHPTIAEEFTRISITKKSGLNPRQLACCS